MAEERFIDEDLPCPECAYNLHGLTVPRCPECGFRFEWSDLPELRENRQQDGGRIALWLALLLLIVATAVAFGGGSGAALLFVTVVVLILFGVSGAQGYVELAAASVFVGPPDWHRFRA